MDEEEFLTQEQIDEILNTKYVFDYYVYFDKNDGIIQCISNEIHNHYDASIKVEFEEVERFFNNTDQHFNFKVVFDEDGKHSFVNRLVTSTLKINVIETIRITDKECILTVIWTKDGWEFVMSENFLQHSRAKSLNSKLKFFVTLENNINYLVREIEIQLRNLINNGKVLVPFESDKERDIDNISIITTPFFESYGMKIHE